MNIAHHDLAQRALAVATAAPHVDSGMWYSDDYIVAAGRAGRRLRAHAAIPGATAAAGLARVPGRNLYALRLRQGYAAASTLRAFIAGPSITDCGTWVQALQYEIILRIVGAAAFDRFFGSDGPYGPLTLDATGATPLWVCFRTQTDVTRDTPIAVGDAVYFPGVPGYTRKHPCGVAQGWHVLCCDVRGGVPHYIGLGFNSPVTAEQLQLRLVAEHNVSRTWTEHLIAWCRPIKHALRWHGVRAHVDNLDGAPAPTMMRLHRRARLCKIIDRKNLHHADQPDMRRSQSATRSDTYAIH